ncbi:hypothetical protein E3J79_00995 [Candidatus Dependentiae bacterium]|nr:MAG: hypothetical protein E3J79_00995 [Candidatus Dependentiae bacterium]
MNKFMHLKGITDDFLAILHELYGFYYDCLLGFEANLIRFENLKKNGCPGKIIAHGSPDDPNTIILHKAPINELIDRNGNAGLNVNQLRGYMIIMISEHWNNKIRMRIAKLFKKELNDIRSYIMGDINKIRNDLLHSRGKANKSASNKIIKFEKESMIMFDEEVFHIIFAEIFKYINKLFEQEFGQKGYTNNSFNQHAIQQHLARKNVVVI